MIAAIALGLRLAVHTSRPGQLRAAMVALASAAGTATILAVLAFAAADRETNPIRYADPGMDRFVMAIVTVVGLQVAALAAVAGRLSAALRARRLSNLRLLGLSAARTRIVAAAEVAFAAAGGAAVAVALFPFVRPLLAQLRIGGQAWPEDALDPGPVAMAAVPVLVTAATIALAVLPEQLGARAALGRSRLATVTRPSWWRTAPLALGIALAVYFQAAGRVDDEAAWMVLAALLLLGAGMVLVVPIFVRLVAAAMLRSPRSPALLVAGRRMQAQPASINRVVTGLLLALFLVVGARAVVVAFESLPQYIGASHQVHVEQRVGAVVPAAGLPDALVRIATVPGVRDVVAYPELSTACGRTPGPGDCVTGIVATCAQLTFIDPTVEGCRDGEVLVAGFEAFAPDTSDLTWIPRRDHVPDPANSITTPAPVATLLASKLHAVIIPPSLPQAVAIAAIADHHLIVTGDPGRDLAERLGASGAVAYAYPPWDVSDYDYVAMLRGTVYAVAAVVLGLGLLAFAIAAVDRAIARRRELVSLRLVGIPARTLRRSQWIEAVVPTAVGSVLAVALGHLAGATYLSLAASDMTVPWQPTIVLAGVAAAGGVLVAALTVLATNQPVTADTIRSE